MTEQAYERLEQQIKQRGLRCKLITSFGGSEPGKPQQDIKAMAELNGEELLKLLEYQQDKR